MKPLLVLGIFACALVSSSAQEAAKMDLVIEKKKQTVVSPGQTGKGKELELKKRLEFDHFFANLTKTNNAIKVFDLTQPVDEKKSKELVTEKETSHRVGRRAPGIKLLTIRF